MILPFTDLFNMFDSSHRIQIYGYPHLIYRHGYMMWLWWLGFFWAEDLQIWLGLQPDFCCGNFWGCLWILEWLWLWRWFWILGWFWVEVLDSRICRPGSWSGRGWVGNHQPGFCQTLTPRSDSPSLFILRKFSDFSDFSWSVFFWEIGKLSLPTYHKLSSSLFPCLSFICLFICLVFYLHSLCNSYVYSQNLAQTCLQCPHIFQQSFIAINSISYLHCLVWSAFPAPQ